MGAKITKFPVTAPDGTEFRVDIRERKSRFEPWRVEVALIDPSKSFGSKTVWWRAIYSEMGGIYDRKHPDYVRIAKHAVAEYYAGIEADKKNLIAKLGEAMYRANALMVYEAWDGKITEVSAE